MKIFYTYRIPSYWRWYILKISFITTWFLVCTNDIFHDLSLNKDILDKLQSSDRDEQQKWLYLSHPNVVIWQILHQHKIFKGYFKGNFKGHFYYWVAFCTYSLDCIICWHKIITSIVTEYWDLLSSELYELKLINCIVFSNFFYVFVSMKTIARKESLMAFEQGVKSVILSLRMHFNLYSPTNLWYLDSPVADCRHERASCKISLKITIFVFCLTSLCSNKETLKTMSHFSKGIESFCRINLNTFLRCRVLNMLYNF